MIRGPLALLAFAIAAVALLLLTAVRPDLMYATTRLFCRFLLWVIGVRLHAEGEFPKGGTYVVMANHSSFIDLFLLPTVMRGRFTGVMAREMMRVPLLQPVLRRFRVVAIEREGRESAIASLGVAEGALREGYHVLILPEGTRTTTGALLPFKSGGFHMAAHARVPILPIGIVGAFEFKPKDRWTIAPGPVRLRIGSPVSPEIYDTLGPAGVKEHVREKIQALISEAEA